MPCLRSFILISMLLLTGFIGQCQSMLATDVCSAFHTQSKNPVLIRLNPNGIQVPAGGHLQGIQSLNDSLLLITASSASYSYYLIAQVNSNTGTGELKSIQKITDSPFRHAGGCQVYGHTLAVGVEDNQAKNKSDIMLITLSNAGQELVRHIAAYRHGAIKRSTAGAVGFTKTKTGQYMLAVGDWDTKNIDIYISRPGIDTVFDSLTTFHISDIKKLPSYQSINLLTDTEGNMYMVAFSLFDKHNRADLFQLHFNTGGVQCINKGIFNFDCKGGAGFRFGSGIQVDNNQISIYSCGRGTRPYTAVNIFGKTKTK